MEEFIYNPIFQQASPGFQKKNFPALKSFHKSFSIIHLIFIFYQANSVKGSLSKLLFLEGLIALKTLVHH